MQLNLPNLQAEGREKQDIKATVTVAMAVVTFYACYLPAITYSVWRSNTKYFTKHVWVSFLVAFCTFISSASNPVIYVLRNKRYRKAIRQLVKDPFGSSSFQEKPIKNDRREKRRRPEHVLKLSKGEEPGVSTVHEETHERGVGDGNFATGQMFLADKIVKIAWKAKSSETSQKIRPAEEDQDGRG